MSDDARPHRRLRAVPPGATPGDAVETAASVLPGSPRVAALDALLREVDGLRLTLESHLGAAADAVESGDVHLAQDILDNELDGLRGFEDRTLGHLSELSSGSAAGRRRHWWTRVPAAPFVAAAALVGFLVGVVPDQLAPATSDPTTSSVSANSSLGRLTQLATAGAPASQIEAASDQLHAQLAPLIAAAKTDPEVARQVLAWLNAERTVLQSSGGDSKAIDALLRQSNALSQRITAALPSAVRASVTAPGVAVPIAAPSARPTKPAPKPAPSATPSARPATQPTSSPSPSPSPSAAPSGTSDPAVLPSSPGLGD